MQDFTFKLLEDDTYCVTGYQGDEADVVIPDTFLGLPITIVYDDLFRGHTEIESVKIPDTVTDIGSAVFDGCTGLHRIKLPKQLRNLWQYAFARSSFEVITLPPFVNRIFPFTFKNCKELKTVVCNDALREVGAWAFEGCDHLTEFLHSPNTCIDPRAFDSRS